MAPRVPPSAYPPARRAETATHLHGVTIAEPYAWLDDQTRPEVRAWRAAQQDLSAGVLSALPRRGFIRDTLDSLPEPVDDGPPIRRGAARFSFTSSQNGGAALVRAVGAARAVVLDPMRISATQALRLAPEFTFVSPTGRYAAAALSSPGTDRLLQHVFDLTSGALIASGWGEIGHAQVEWAPDERGFYYAVCRSLFTGSAAEDGVYFHVLGQAWGEDRRVFPQPEDVGHIALPILLRGGALLAVKTLNFVTQEAALHVCGEGGPRTALAFGGPFNIVAELGGEVLIETTRGAARGRMLAADPSSPAPTWREVVGEQEHALALGHHSTWAPWSAAAGGRIFGTYVVDAAHRVRAFDLQGRLAGEAAIPGLYTVRAMQAEGDAAEVVISRFTTPCARYRIDPATLAAEERESVAAPMGECETMQVFCTSADGTRVPIFIVRRRGAAQPAPTLLYGYGGWGQSLTPTFRPDLAAWVALGGVYAIANIRGGGEYGQACHDAGARLNRKKTFEDFAAAGDHLIARGVARASGLAARGLSNGGLMLAATANMRPDLFAAIGLGVPLVDVVNLMNLPAGPAIAAELGDPTKDRAALEYMLSYSPAHNVRAAPRRPAVLVIPGERDERAPIGGALKYLAALQESAAADQPALLRVVEGEGHIGWPRAVERDVLVDEIAFLWACAAEREA